ncbi:hypothetical protein FA13DRAFT_1726324 [Coprinellus micaceus]|uniref:Uncharacterized protein n=1 Tax=Coprinellus micaceus TaxID=71717 RepID=A0A4Y7TSU2_COPMI|nr:hypothetical protein FA13DRAFT_1726324 [Coprinellus micaceus]
MAPSVSPRSKDEVPPGHRREPHSSAHNSNSDPQAARSYNIQGTTSTIVNGDFSGVQFNGTTNGYHCVHNSVSTVPQHHHTNSPRPQSTWHEGDRQFHSPRDRDKFSAHHQTSSDIRPIYAFGADRGARSNHRGEDERRCHPPSFVAAPSSRRGESIPPTAVYALPAPAPYPGVPPHHNGRAPTVPSLPQGTWQPTLNYYDARRPPGSENADTEFNPARWGHPYSTDMASGPGSFPGTIGRGGKHFNPHAPSKRAGSRN